MHALPLAALLALACQKDEAAAPKPTPAGAPAAAAATPAAPAAPRDPCKLLSAADVKAAAGVEAEGNASRSGGADVCTWTSAEGKSAVVQIFPAAAKYDESRQAFEASTKTPPKTSLASATRRSSSVAPRGRCPPRRSSPKKARPP